MLKIQKVGLWIKVMEALRCDKMCLSRTVSLLQTSS